MAPRIISLIASSTEIVCALGFESSLVGISHECDYPESILKLPRCTKPRFETDGSSLDIDIKVKEALQEGLGVYEIDGKLIQSLTPSLILTQSQCEVCAVSLQDVHKIQKQFLDDKTKILALKTDNLDDLFADILRVSQALDVEARGFNLIEALKIKMDRINTTASRKLTKPRVACIEWIAPLMAAGNWVPELVEMAGGTNLFGEKGQHSPTMQFQDLVQSDPDILLIMPCGFDIPRTLNEIYPLTEDPGWHNLKAVREGRVFALDGNQYFNRPGPRMLDSLQILAEIFYPETFSFGHQNIGWLRVD